MFRVWAETLAVIVLNIVLVIIVVEAMVTTDTS